MWEDWEGCREEEEGGLLAGRGMGRGLLVLRTFGWTVVGVVRGLMCWARLKCIETGKGGKANSIEWELHVYSLNVWKHYTIVCFI